MEGIIKKWGNSASVRIPAVIMRAVKLNLDEVVDVREEDGRIVIEPATRRKQVSLSSLVKGMTARNAHKEADFGGPVGKEVF